MNRNGINDWIDMLSGNISGTDVELPVLSGSMAPFLPVDSIAVVRFISKEDISSLGFGTIIVYRTKFRLTAHRMIMRIPLTDYVYEKGDRNRFGSFIRCGEIIGIVSSVKQNNGLIHDFFTKSEKMKAKRAAVRSLLGLIKHKALTPARRIKNVLVKK